MRILYLASGLPYPLTTGRLRHYFMLRELSRRHEVVLVTLGGRVTTPRDVEAVRELTEVRVIPRGRRGRSYPARAARALRIPDLAERELAAEAADLARRWKPDVVCFTGRRSIVALDAVRPLPVVADLCDAASLAMRSRLRHAAPRTRPAIALRLLALLRIERMIMRRSHAMFFATTRDRDETLGRGAAADPRVAVIPNGVDLDQWVRRAPRLGDAIVFSGAMDYAPNVDAAVRLAEHILPRVREQRPSARLVLVGRDPVPEVRALRAQPGVTVTGFVEDVRPYLEEAAVVAAPLRFGAGIQNKLLEALAMEVPTVATGLAARGLVGEDGVGPPIDVAESDAELAAAIVRRLERAAEDPTPHAAGRAFVAERFAWPAVARLLEQLLEDTARRVADGAGRVGGMPGRRRP